MTGPPVTDKRTMYRLLDAGRFGNTVPRWYDLASWRRALGRYEPTSLWAVRSPTAGDRARSALNLTVARLNQAYPGWYPSGGGEISPMVDHMLTARFHVHEGDAGLVVWIVEGRAEVPWRDAFATLGVHLYGTAARLALRRYLNGNSYDDLWDVLDSFPGHVVELTALDRCHGTTPGRNAVVWEVRNY